MRMKLLFAGLPGGDVILSDSEGSRMVTLRGSVYGILRHFVPQNDREGDGGRATARVAPTGLGVILSGSEGSRVVTLGVLFTGFFTASRFRMTEGAGGGGRFVKRPYNRKGNTPVGAIHESPVLGENTWRKGRRGRRPLRREFNAGRFQGSRPVSASLRRAATISQR